MHRIATLAAAAALGLLSACASDNPPAPPTTPPGAAETAPEQTSGKSWSPVGLSAAKLPTPTDLHAERSAGLVKITWRGTTTDYDLAQCFHDGVRWSNPTVSTLRPATNFQGKYYYGATALPQPMRFQVRAVKGKKKSDWTGWVESRP
jgi:hypothetical protein